MLCESTRRWCVFNKSEATFGCSNVKRAFQRISLLICLPLSDGSSSHTRKEQLHRSRMKQPEADGWSLVLPRRRNRCFRPRNESQQARNLRSSVKERITCTRTLKTPFEDHRRRGCIDRKHIPLKPPSSSLQREEESFIINQIQRFSKDLAKSSFWKNFLSVLECVLLSKHEEEVKGGGIKSSASAFFPSSTATSSYQPPSSPSPPHSSIAHTKRGFYLACLGVGTPGGPTSSSSSADAFLKPQAIKSSRYQLAFAMLLQELLAIPYERTLFYDPVVRSQSDLRIVSACLSEKLSDSSSSEAEAGEEKAVDEEKVEGEKLHFEDENSPLSLPVSQACEDLETRFLDDAPVEDENSMKIAFSAEQSGGFNATTASRCLRPLQKGVEKNAVKNSSTSTASGKKFAGNDNLPKNEAEQAEDCEDGSNGGSASEVCAPLRYHLFDGGISSAGPIEIEGFSVVIQSLRDILSGERKRREENQREASLRVQRSCCCGTGVDYSLNGDWREKTGEFLVEKPSEEVQIEKTDERLKVWVEEGSKSLGKIAPKSESEDATQIEKLEGEIYTAKLPGGGRAHRAETRMNIRATPLEVELEASNLERISSENVVLEAEKKGDNRRKYVAKHQVYQEEGNACEDGVSAALNSSLSGSKVSDYVGEEIEAGMSSFYPHNQARRVGSPGIAANPGDPISPGSPINPASPTNPTNLASVCGNEKDRGSFSEDVLLLFMPHCDAALYGEVLKKMLFESQKKNIFHPPPPAVANEQVANKESDLVQPHSSLKEEGNEFEGWRNAVLKVIFVCNPFSMYEERLKKLLDDSTVREKAENFSRMGGFVGEQRHKFDEIPSKNNRNLCMDDNKPITASSRPSSNSEYSVYSSLQSSFSGNEKHSSSVYALMLKHVLPFIEETRLCGRFEDFPNAFNDTAVIRFPAHSLPLSLVEFWKSVCKKNEEGRGTL